MNSCFHPETPSLFQNPSDQANRSSPHFFGRIGPDEFRIREDCHLAKFLTTDRIVVDQMFLSEKQHARRLLHPTKRVMYERLLRPQLHVNTVVFHFGDLMQESLIFFERP